MAPKTAEKKNQNKKGQQQQQQGTKQDKKVIEWGGRYGAVTGHVLAQVYVGDCGFLGRIVMWKGMS